MIRNSKKCKTKQDPYGNYVVQHVLASQNLVTVLGRGRKDREILPAMIAVKILKLHSDTIKCLSQKV